MLKKTVCVLLCVILTALLLPCAVGEQALAVTYAVPDGRSADALTDANVMTRVTVRRGSALKLTLSHAGGGRTAYLEWFAIPTDATLAQLGADGAALQTTVFEKPDAYAQAIPLDPQCAALVLAPGKADCTVSTLFVAEGAPDAAYARMEPTDACDVLFVAPTPADAMEAFGPVLARYGIAQGVRTGVLCMTVDHRYCAQELERALCEMGFSNAPIYLGCEDLNYLNGDEVAKRWAANDPENKLAARIAALGPKVVVSIGAREGDLRAAETVRIVSDVIADTAVQKLYLAADAGTTVDCTADLAACGGVSAHAFASAAYRRMDSRGMYRFRLPETPAFALVYETVGADAACDDLLEHIDKGTLTHFEEAATPAPPETPVPETEALTAEPPRTEAPAETERPAETSVPEPTAAPKRGLFSCGGVEETPVPSPVIEATDAPTRVPTDAPTESPVPEPTAEPTAEPTPTPALYERTNFDEHFLEPGAEEFVSFDNANGEWIYRSDILAVEITREETTYPFGRGTKPVVYFVAHIYERGYDSFRPTFGSWRHNGIDTADARTMANDAKCVLWITGDNLINNDTAAKGTLIRDGYLFQRSVRFDMFVLDPETHAMRIIHAGEIPAEELWESGVENCFSFGPVTIENGAITPQAGATRRLENPRTMLGMIEPGHFVAVVADGRQPGYSLGLNGQECAELMLSLGCTVAYNLDGGMSATMIFMGNKINRHSAGEYKGLPASVRTMPDGLTWGYSELCGMFADLQENNG